MTRPAAQGAARAGGTRRWLAVAAILAGAALATPAAARVPLSQERHINDRLIAARVADKIRRGCETIDARLVYAWSQARALKRYAEDKGYGPAEIEAFLDSEAEKARIYAAADAYLAQKGATDATGLCRLGREEIARKTIAGSLLVAR